MKNRILISFLCVAVLLAGCGSSAASSDAATASQSNKKNYVTPAGEFINSLPTFEVTSENLSNGVWDKRIASTDSKGENLSPQVSWAPVDNAECYMLYMMDLSAGWIHMKYRTEKTSLDLAEVTNASDLESSWGYVGPYPPKGEPHSYVIYVLALKSADTAKNPGVKNSINNLTLDKMFSMLDKTADGAEGNVLAIGDVGGTYTLK